MPWAAAATIGSAVIGSQSAGRARDAADKQSKENIAAQEKWNQQQDPFSAGGSRAQYVPELNDLMKGGYAGIEEDPMYQWMRKQGVDQATRKMSASGDTNSGNELIALQEQGYGLARNFFNDQYARLAELSGASRGGGQAAVGQSPGAVFNQNLSVGQTNADAWSSGVGSLQRVFGGNSNSPSAGADASSDPYSYGGGTYTGVGNEIKY